MNELEDKIQKLKKAIANTNTPEAFKPNMRSQLAKLEADLEASKEKKEKPAPVKKKTLIVISNADKTKFLSYEMGSNNFLWVASKERANTFDSPIEAHQYEQRASGYIGEENVHFLNYDSLKPAIKPKFSPKSRGKKPVKKTPIKKTTTAPPKMKVAKDDLEDCKEVISLTLRKEKEEKLRKAKGEKISAINQKVADKEITAEQAEKQIKKVNEQSFSEFFTKKKSTTEKNYNLFVAIFNNVSLKILHDVLHSSKVSKDKKRQKFLEKTNDLFVFYTQKVVPGTHEIYLGTVSKGDLQAFKNEANEIITRLVEKLEKSVKQAA